MGSKKTGWFASMPRRDCIVIAAVFLIFSNNLKISMSGIFPELSELSFGVLSRFVSRDTGIDGGTLRFAGHVELVLK
jgi:hypothetical protein